MDIRSMLLGFLMYGDMTGYDLKKFFSLSFSFFSGLSYGSIYPALKKLEQEGLISMRMEVRDGAPTRKVYTITDAGKEAFTEVLKSPVPAEKPKSPLLTRLFFFSFLAPGERIEAVNGYLESIREVQEELEKTRPEIEGHADHYQQLCYQFGVRMYQGMVANISEILKDLESEAKAGEK